MNNRKKSFKDNPLIINEIEKIKRQFIKSLRKTGFKYYL